MNKKLCVYLPVLALLTSGCSGTKDDLRTSKTKTDSPVIYSTASNILGSGLFRQDWLYGEVVQVNKNKINTKFAPSKILLDPGTYQVKMSWRSSKKPSNSGNVTSNSHLVPAGFVVLSARVYEASKTFDTSLTVRKGYNYFVNVKGSIIDNNNYVVPKKLCISEIIQSAKLEKAPIGEMILAPNKGKIVTCSK